MKCDLGYTLYAGHCVPSHFTIQEKEEFVRRQKKAKKRSPVVFIGLIALVVGLWFVFNGS